MGHGHREWMFLVSTALVQMVDLAEEGVMHWKRACQGLREMCGLELAMLYEMELGVCHFHIN